MARSLLMSAVVAALIVGCVSVGPTATDAPTIAPTFGITTPAPATAAPTIGTPTAAPTQTPTVEPTVEPTDEPVVTPDVTPDITPGPPLTPAPSVAVIEDFGADQLLFSDDFSDPESGWGSGTNAGGTYGYVDGALQFDTVAEDYWMFAWRLVDSSAPVVHVEADLLPSAAGSQGLLCAGSEDEFWGGIASDEGTWAFIQVTVAGATILASGQQEGFEIVPAATTLLALDCAGTDTGQFRMQLSLPDLGLAASYVGEVGQGPGSFDRTAVYVNSAAHPYTLRADNLFVHGGSGETGVMSGEAQALAQHIPAAWRVECFETEPSPFEIGAQTAVSCPVPGVRSDVVDYVQFDTKENMDAAYQARVEDWAVAPTSSCQTGPNETSYTVGGSPAGRLLCAPQTVGARYDWTHDALLIMTTLTDFDGLYADLYEDWLIAGPD